MAVQFRNVTTSWEDPIAEWPYEALVTTIERGLVSDWQPILREIRRDPFGPIAHSVAHYLKTPDDEEVAAFFAEALKRARGELERAEQDAVIARIKAALEASHLPQAEFAKRLGTSASRLSTYLSGKVVPSATMLLRAERLNSV